ncbi:MAG: ABC transporter permease [Candidatus Promineifilaceae bacterium]
MRKLFYIARFEFVRHIKRRGFIFAVVGLPAILIGVSVLVGLFFSTNADKPFGIVDQSGLFTSPEAYTSFDKNDPPILGYPDEAEAQTALHNEEIQAFFLIPPDYLQTGNVTVFHNGNPNDDIYDAFRNYARTSLLQSADPAVATRLTEGAVDVSFVSLSKNGIQANPLAAILPFIFGFMIVMAIFTTGGYLLQAVVDEKENRTMEILATSVKPEYIMTGKIVGLVALGLVQLSIWAAGGAAIFFYFRSRVPEIASLSFPIETAVIALLWFIPFYLVIATIWTAIGLMVTEVSEGQQAMGIISMLTMSPLWLLALFIQNPGSPLAIAFTLIPFTAPLTILMRQASSIVPFWQMALSWTILLLTAALGLFAVSRLLRIGMLRYGKRVTLRELAQQLRS